MSGDEPYEGEYPGQMGLPLDHGGARGAGGGRAGGGAAGPGRPEEPKRRGRDPQPLPRGF